VFEGICLLAVSSFFLLFLIFALDIEIGNETAGNMLHTPFALDIEIVANEHPRMF
jgi:hypothetical protein